MRSITTLSQPTRIPPQLLRHAVNVGSNHPRPSQTPLLHGTNRPDRPLKAQVGIRDHWKKEDGPLQTTLRDLEGLIGHSVVIEPEWPLIVAELDSFYEDKNNLIAIVAGCVQAWAKSMMELLEDPAHADWTDTLLEKIPVRMRVYVEVAGSASAATAWSEQRDGFVLSLPKKTVYQPAELFPVFRGGLLPCFEVKKKPQLPVRQADSGAADEWEGVEVDATTGTAQVAQAPRASYAPAAARPKVEFLPNMASLPRPDQLFLQPPYYLSLIHGHHQIELHCSHSPTLELLAEYLKRWCRINHADTRNASLLPHCQTTSCPSLTAVVCAAPRRLRDSPPVALWPRRAL